MSQGLPAMSAERSDAGEGAASGRDDRRAERPEREGRRFRRRIGVVDIGSNSIRLVVFDRPGRVPVPVFNERVICGLGKGLAGSGKLNQEGVDLALANLRRFAGLAAAMEVRELVLLATAAVREAENGPAFVAEAEGATGHRVQVLDGAQEATLAAYGVIVGIPQADGIAADLGGGSLELIAMRQGSLGQRVTLPLGPLRLLDGSKGDRQEAAGIIEAALDRVAWLEDFAGRSFFAVGGAWRNLARMHMEQSDYPLHVIQSYTVPASVAVDFAEMVARQGRRSLSKVPSVSRRRVDTLPMAALVLSKVLQRMRASNLVFSSFGLREGYLYERLGKAERAKDPLLLTAEDIARREGRFPRLGKALLDWLTPIFLEERGLQRRLVEAACHLGDVAWREHPDYRARQALSRLLYFPYAGLDHPGRAFLSLVAYQRYGGDIDETFAEPARALLPTMAHHEARLLGLGLRLAYSVSGGAAPVLARTDLTTVGRSLRLTLPDDGILPPGDALDRRLEALATALGQEETQVLFASS